MIKKSLKSKTSKSHTWAPLNYEGEGEENGKEGSMWGGSRLKLRKGSRTEYEQRRNPKFMIGGDKVDSGIG